MHNLPQVCNKHKEYTLFDTVINDRFDVCDMMGWWTVFKG